VIGDLLEILRRPHVVAVAAAVIAFRLFDNLVETSVSGFVTAPLDFGVPAGFGAEGASSVHGRLVGWGQPLGALLAFLLVGAVATAAGRERA
jgi:large-conductance mechanosensitive channel